MPEKAVSELAPTGVLRVAINMGNFLLVTGKAPNADPTGVSPDMALAIGARLGVPVKFIPYARPGEIADDAEKGKWDIGNIGAEPQRAAVISFTAAYAEIEATYLVPAGSPIRSIAEIDQPGKRVAVTARSAYGLWLENNYKKGRAAAVRHGRGGAQGVRRREARRLCRVAAGPDRGAAGAARLAHSRRAVHRRAAGGRHAEEERGRVRVPEGIRRRSKAVRDRGELHRAPRCGRPAVGSAARLNLRPLPTARPARLPRSFHRARRHDLAIDRSRFHDHRRDGAADREEAAVAGRADDGADRAGPRRSIRSSTPICCRPSSARSTRPAPPKPRSRPAAIAGRCTASRSGSRTSTRPPASAPPGTPGPASTPSPPPMRRRCESSTTPARS